MCGIVSVIAKKAWGFTKNEIDIFEELLFVDALRGDDATGVITVEKSGVFHIDKAAVVSADFLPQYRNLPSAKGQLQYAQALIGHNRKGTVGGFADNMAHPFVINDRFAMVHNGTLHSHKQLADTGSDSEALATVIDKALNDEYTGDSDERDTYILAGLESTLGKISGAYACVWYNQLEHKVQFVRNDQRPLWIADCDNIWVLGSEPGMLHWILSRHSVKIVKLEAVDKDALYTLDLNVSGQVLVPLTKKELVIKKYTPPTQAQGMVGDITMGYTGTTGTEAELSKNLFKKLRRKLMHKPLVFYVEDYIEKYLFKKNGPEYCVWGASDELGPLKHIVRGEIDITKVDISDISHVDNYVFTGVIDQIEYNMRLKQIELTVEHIKKCPPSIILPYTNKEPHENTATL